MTFFHTASPCEALNCLILIFVCKSAIIVHVAILYKKQDLPSILLFAWPSIFAETSQPIHCLQWDAKTWQTRPIPQPISRITSSGLIPTSDSKTLRVSSAAALISSSEASSITCNIAWWLSLDKTFQVALYSCLFFGKDDWQSMLPLNSPGRIYEIIFLMLFLKRCGKNFL